MREVKCDKQKGNRGHSFSTYTKFFENYYPLIRTRMCAYQKVRNVSFSKNFVYVLNG